MTSLRYLQKGPEYLRSTCKSSQNSDDKRLTATERLEADKFKYVKSAQARRRRATYDFHGCVPGRNADSTGSHSAGSDSTISPTDDDIIGFTGNDVLIYSRADGRAKPEKMNSNQNTNQPIIDDAVRLRAHPSRRPRPKSSTVGGVVFATSFQAEPKQATKAHKYQGGLTADEKAKCCRENLDQTVSLSATRVHNNPKSDRRRVSDRICPKPTYFRSASVGTTTPRQSDTSENFSHTVSQAILMSPRSHLRHVRQNLKKVYPTKMDENRSITDVRLRGKTTNSQPNNGEKVGDCNLPGNEHVKLRQNKPQRPRPFSVIENIKHFEFGSHFFSEKHSRTDRKTALESNANQETHNNVTVGNNETSSTNEISSRHLKRRSLELSHTTNFQLPLQQQTVETSEEVLEPETTPIASERGFSKRCITGNYQSNVVEPFENTKSTQKGSGRNSNITEALEKILIPSDNDNEVDATHCSMDADSKTLLANSYNDHEATTKTFFAVNINNALCGKTQHDSGFGGSRSSESPDSQMHTHDEQLAESHQEMLEINSFKNPVEICTRTREGDVDIFIPQNRKWVNDNGYRTNCQPYNRIDLAPPNQNRNGPGQCSPMLSPRARKEIVPDCSRSGNTASSFRAGKDHLNTLKSQTTISTTSGDNNKSLAALTASDLKPRRDGRGSATHSTPLKPTCPYSSNCRTSPKRHNNAPLSPTTSPNKQFARTGPPLSARSASSTPYSSLKRSPHATKSSSLKRNRQRSKSDVSTFQSDLDQFFSTMGMEESLVSPYPMCDCIDNLVSSESDFSFAGASAYVRDGPDESMEVDPISARLASVPTVSVIEKNARVMRWIMSCKKSLPHSNSQSRCVPSSPAVPPRPHFYHQANHHTYSNRAPPIPPRTYHTFIPKESNV